MRIILFTGKGGVGKTTLAAATALRSASLGYKTLVISTDIAHSLADALDIPLQNDPLPIAELPLHAAELDTGEELERYWGDIKRRIASLLREEGLEATIASELAILPGLDEILALVRIKRYCDEGRYDVLIIDSAPTGAAMRLLAAPDLNRSSMRQLLGLSRGLTRALLPALRSLLKAPLGEELLHERIQQLFQQVEALRLVLTDGAQTSVRLVLNAEHMSLRETQRAYTYLNLFGLVVDALFVNRLLPEEIQDPFFLRWKEDQNAHRQEAQELFAPLPVFEIPLMPQEVVGLAALEALAAQVYGASDPTALLSHEQPLRFYSEGQRYFLALRVTGVAIGAVELEKRGDELGVKLGTFRRTLALPQYLASLQPAWAQVERDYLKIAFEERPPTNPV